MKEVLILRDLECIKAVVHQKRIDILNKFDEEPLSAKQLSILLDEPHAKINYHIKMLYKFGILELVEQKIKSGIVEKYYYPKAKKIIIDKNVINIYLETESDKIYISKFEEIASTFYDAAQEDILIEENVIDYENISLTGEEITKLNEYIRLKIREILSDRDSNGYDQQYDIAMISVPTTRQENIL